MSSENADQLAILNGGVEIEVTKIDSSKERVKVRQLPIRLIPEWMANLGNEPRLIELYLNENTEFVDRIVVEHQELILEIGQKLNFPTYDRWIARMQAATGRALNTAEAVAASNETIKARTQALGMPAPTSPSP